MIIHINHPASYNTYTITPAVTEFAKKINHDIEILRLDQAYKPTDEYTILVLEGYQFREAYALVHQCGSNIDNIKNIFPNSHIIVLGSYTNTIDGFIEYDHPSKVDLHLDTSYDVVKYYKTQNIITDLFLWSGSQPIFDLAKQFTDTTSVDKSRDCICLSRCEPSFYDRSHLFNGIQSHGLSLGFNFYKENLNDVFFEYLVSEVSIGTTSPSSDVLRNGKGFRDWLSPFLNCLLIHDDYEGYIDLYKNVVPMYEYNNIQDCIDKIKYIKNLNNTEKQNLLKKQIQFAELNTIENQLFRAYKKYILKTEPEIEILQKIN